MLNILEIIGKNIKALVEYEVPGWTETFEYDVPGRTKTFEYKVPGWTKRTPQVFTLREFCELRNGPDLLAKMKQSTSLQ